MQKQSVTELTDKLKPDCLLKISVFRPFANKLIILIVIAVGLVSIFGYEAIFKGKDCNSYILILESGYSKEGNIQTLKTRSFSKKMVSNINITFTESFSKLCGRPKIINTQKILEKTLYKVIINLDFYQNLDPNMHKQSMQWLPEIFLFKIIKNLDVLKNQL